VVVASKNSSPKAILHEFLPVTVKVSELLRFVTNSVQGVLKQRLTILFSVGYDDKKNPTILKTAKR